MLVSGADAGVARAAIVLSSGGLGLARGGS